MGEKMAWGEGDVRPHPISDTMGTLSSRAVQIMADRNEIDLLDGRFHLGYSGQSEAIKIKALLI